MEREGRLDEASEGGREGEKEERGGREKMGRRLREGERGEKVRGGS